MDLNKYIITGDNSKSFHSSGLAKVANGNRIGSAAPVSFNQRRQVDDNRRIINVYSRSTIGNSFNRIRPRPVVRPMARPVSNNRRSSLQQHNSLRSSVQPISIKSIPKKGYDPFA